MERKEVQRVLEQFARNVYKQARANLTRKGKNDSKDLYDSLKFEEKELNVGENSIDLNLVMETYGMFQDKGVRGAGGVRKTTSRFNTSNNKGKLWKIKAKDSPYRFGKAGGVSPKHFKKWANKRGLNEFAVAKSVYHQGIEKSLFFTRAFELAYEKLPKDLVEAYALDLESFIEFTTKDILKNN